MFFKHCKWAMLWALIILVLCGIPGRDIPHISFLEILNFDKFVHAGIFFVLILLTVRGFLLQTNFIKLQQSAKLIAFIICVVFGGSLEILQGTLFEGRTADVFDFVANSFGAILGLLMYNWVEKMFLERLIK
jgi:glycopeptide antibiotics resistance protein